MVLPVAVEIAPPDSPKESIAVLLAACTRAKRGGECVLAADVAGGGTSAVAIVTWQGNARALVEVGLLVTQPGDRESDFQEIYDFGDAFGGAYDWSGIPGA